MTASLIRTAILLAAFASLGFPGHQAVAIGDPERGRIAAGEYGCLECHSADGDLTGNGTPYLAGQKQGYLIRTMLAFKYGRYTYRGEDGTLEEEVVSRTHPHMTDVAEGLTVQTIQNLAAFYATRRCDPPVPAAEIPVQPEGAAHCEICHGGVRTNPWSEMPYLSGQDADYLRAQVAALFDGTVGENEPASRHNRLAEVMFAGMTRTQLDEIVTYFAGMDCPR